MDIFVGTYIGDGNDDRAIGGVGFQPDVVLINNNTDEWAVVWTSEMAANESFIWAFASEDTAGWVKAVGADGFTVGTANNVNQNGAYYYFMCLRINGGTDLKLGKYTGDGADNRSIVVAVGYEPDLVMCFHDASGSGTGVDNHWRSDDMAGEDSRTWRAEAFSDNKIQALEANGFQIGDSTRINWNGHVYYYVAIQFDDTYIEGGTYTGDGNDDRDIATLITAALVWTGRDGASIPFMRTDDIVGDSSLSFQGWAVADRIQSMGVNKFQVGTNNSVNANLSPYAFVCFKEGTTGVAGIPTIMDYYFRRRLVE